MSVIQFFYLLFGCSVANFGPLLREHLIQPMLITVFINFQPYIHQQLFNDSFPRPLNVPQSSSPNFEALPPRPPAPHKGAGSHVFDISEKLIFLCQMTSDHILAMNCFLVMRTHNLQSITT